MKRVKSTPQDEIILADENANPVERSSSATKLLSDGYGKVVVPVLEQWFEHRESILREDAVSLLLASLGHEKYVDKAIKILHSDTDYVVRHDAARGLAKFCVDFIEGKKYENQINKELLLALVQDNEPYVQKECYKGLCRIITGKNLKEDKDSFDLNQDVNWNLLQPYLDKYGLQKPI